MKLMQSWIGAGCVSGLALGFLTGCGGGAVGSASASGATGTVVPVTSGSVAVSGNAYNFFNDASHVYAVNLSQANPVPVVVDQLSSDSLFSKQNWMFDQMSPLPSGGEQWSGSYLVYVNNNHFYRLASVSNGVPVPVQVSNESQAGLLCGSINSFSGGTLATISLSYVLPGPDGQCGTSDDINRTINLGMSATDVPLIQQSSGIAVYAAVDSAIVIGSLSVNQGSLYYTDAATSSSILLSGYSQLQSVQSVATSSSGNAMLLALTRSTASGIDTVLVAFDMSAKTLSSPEWDFGSSTYYPNFYHIINGNYLLVTPTNQILLIPEAGGSGSVVASFSGTIGAQIQEGSNLVLTVTDSSGINSIYALNFLQQQPVSLLLKSGVVVNTFAMMLSSDRIFYELADSYTAGSVRYDGTGDVEYTNSLWIGGSTIPQYVTNGTYPYNINHALMLNNVSGSAPGQGIETGGQIVEADPSSGLITQSLTNLPSTVQTAHLATGLAVDRSGVVVGMDLPSSSGNEALFVLNTQTKTLTTMPNTSILSNWLLL